MKTNSLLIVCVLFLMLAIAYGQETKDLGDALLFKDKVSFNDLVQYDMMYPELKPKGRRIKNSFEPPATFPINIEDIVYQSPKFDRIGQSSIKEESPLPELDFLGLDDSGSSIPPDVNGGVGPDHIVVTLNTEIRIMDKSGLVLSTIGTGSFWQGIPGAGGVFDPKIYYDPYDDRWIFTMPSSGDPTTTRLMVAVSETSDPTGTWYRYSFDGDPNDELWFDYPDFGFNKKWVVVTGNMIASLPVHGVVYVFNKSDLYNFALEIDYSRIEIEIGDGLSLIPAVTMDENEEDVYMVSHAGGNVGGYGYLKLRKVTGDVSDPQIEDIGLVGVPHPWNEWSYFENGDFAPQLGSEDKINTVDGRFQTAVFRNNKIWCVHHVYLPAEDPTYAAIQWWELSTDGTVLQWGREDGGDEGMVYAFPSIAVNAKEDIMIGYASFSADQYASASYSFRYGDDPVNELRDRYQYKEGLAPYYKTFGGNRNRWGDYSVTCVDPVNDLDFWTLQEYAELPSGQDEWGTWWAKVNVETMPEAHFTSNITSVPVGSGVDFFDISKFEPDEWKWIFEGATPASSNVQNPSDVVYEEEGLFDVTFIAINAHGADTIALEDYIDANTTILPEVYFTVNDTIPCLGDTLMLNDQTIYNPVAWFWEFTPNYVTFINGTDETSQNPQVIFEFPFAYDISLTATNNNGSSSLTKTDFIKAGGESLPFYENFESLSFDRMGWTIENPDDDKTWEITNVEGNEPGGLAAYVNIKSYDGLNERDRLISPPLNFYSYKDINFSFQYAYSQRFPQYTDSLIVYISSDCGNSWEPIIALGEDGTGTFATAGPMMDNFVPVNPEDWCGQEGVVECVSLDLSEWSGQSNVRIMFESFNGFGNNLFIDNLEIDGEIIGVEETVGKKEYFSLSPNPTDGMVYLSFKNPGPGVTANIYHMSGSLVSSVMIETSDKVFVMDLTGLKSGLYFVTVNDGISIYTRKLILN